MGSFVRALPQGLLFSLGTALLVSGAGCVSRTSPPGADSISTSSPDMTITYLRWKEGLTVLFVDDVKGDHNSHGAGSTSNPVYTATLAATSADARGYKCQLETTDGVSATCRINGKEYDLAKGTLFVIKADGEQGVVHQSKRDLTSITFDLKGCREPLEKDAEIRKLLGLADLPK
jgi:hypothetical protein